MTIFAEEELVANVRLNLTEHTPAGILNAQHDLGYNSPSRALFSLRDCIDQGWFGKSLDTDTRRSDYLTKIHVTFKRTWDTAKYYLEAFTQAKVRIQELENQVKELEQATQHVAETSIQREQSLKDQHRDDLQELEAQIQALRENKGQLEARIGQLERDSELNQTLPDAPARGPWERVKTPKLSATNLDEVINARLEQAQLFLLDPTLFPFIWKEQTGQDLTTEEQAAWQRAISPF